MSRHISPLTNFVMRQSDAPYTATYDWLGDRGCYIFPVRPKVQFGMARRGAYVHRVAGAAAFAHEDVLTFGSRWACGGGSPAVEFLAEIGDRILCPECIRRPEPTVYRFYDSADCLLYAGCSINPSSRLRQHKVLQPWWESVERTTFETFPTAQDALSAELKAIIREKPVYNDDIRVRGLTGAAA